MADVIFHSRMCIGFHDKELDWTIATLICFRSSLHVQSTKLMIPWMFGEVIRYSPSTNHTVIDPWWHDECPGRVERIHRNHSSRFYVTLFVWERVIVYPPSHLDIPMSLPNPTIPVMDMILIQIKCISNVYVCMFTYKNNCTTFRNLLYNNNRWNKLT